MVEILERPLPNNAEAERAILGAVMLDNALITQAVNSLSPDDFYVPSHRRIFLAMVALSDANTEINPILIGEELGKNGEVESVGGLSFISNLTYGLPHFANINHYARIVREHAERRRMIKLADEWVSRSLDGDESNEQLAEWIDARVSAFKQSSERRSPASIPTLLQPQLDRFARFHKNISDAVPTGFPELDNNLTGKGLMRSHLHIIAARPSLGKTSLALDIAANAALSGSHVYFISLEMSKEVLLDRLFSVASGVSRWKLQPGLSDLDLHRLAGVSGQFEGLPFVIDDVNRSTAQIARGIRQVHKQRLVDLIVVDYLQLMDTNGRGTRNDEVGANTRALQAIAKEFNCPVLCLSQLSRKSEAEKREPELRDLRDSGEIEQDARTVFFLFGDKGEEDLTDTHHIVAPPLYRDITIKCAKQGEGKLFRAPLPFNTQLVTFRSAGQVIAGHVQDDLQDYNF